MVENYITKNVLDVLGGFKKEDFENGYKVREMWDNECKKENILKCLNKIKNVDVEGFEKIKSWSILEYANSHVANNKNCLFSDEMNRTWIDSIETKAELTTEERIMIFASNILNQLTFLIEHGKKVKISAEVKNLLSKTDIELKYKSDFKLPFKQIFIDMEEIEQENNSWFGILLEECFCKNFKIKGVTKEKENCLKIFLVGRDNNDGECIYCWDYLSDEGRAEGKRKGNISDEQIFYNLEEENKFKDKIFKIALNFINLVNHPEVQIINHSKKEIRENKARKKRLGIPDSIEINLTGKLRKYIYEDLPKQKEAANNYSHKFWVRGHWMNFTSPRYINMKGKKKWILPYIKGRGELISKDYYLGEKEKQWEHENRMKKIILSIYPNKGIKNNIRTELNGLEIDCYLPELKLGFEYNGEQHYNHVKIFHKTIKDFEAQKERDIKKNELAKEKGIRLITIRYDEPLTEKLILSKIKGDKNGKQD